MSIRLIDTHCHLTELPEAELEAQLARAHEAGVDRVICIGAGYGVDAAKRAIKLTEKYRNIWATVGIHPHDAEALERFSEIEELASHPRVVGIGETGLDHFRNWSPFDLQEQLFRKTIALARAQKKPLVIHCREAREMTYHILQEEGAAEVGGVFHCYSEDAEFAKKLEALNFVISFPGSLTFKKADALRQVADAVPLERIMLETDAPYMAPEPFRGKQSEPAHVRIIAETLAKVKLSSIEQIAFITTQNAERIFKLPKE